MSGPTGRKQQLGHCRCYDGIVKGAALGLGRLELFKNGGAGTRSSGEVGAGRGFVGALGKYATERVVGSKWGRSMPTLLRSIALVLDIENANVLAVVWVGIMNLDVVVYPKAPNNTIAFYV